ncbi:MAG TPA: amino acid permease, partial [Mycobacterium sp.]|nr:amino acid permease [Mycobacterium sp.]
IGLNLPEWMLGAPGSDPDQPGRVVDLFALLLCLLIAFILTRGVRSAARVETLLVWLKVGVVVLIVVLGVFYVNTDNYTPFLPFGWGGVFAGASVVFFAVFNADLGRRHSRDRDGYVDVHVRRDPGLVLDVP